jgi:hypothetical protein
LNSLFLSLPREFELFVVEDTMGGIRSTQTAGEILQKNRFDVKVHALGLTSGSAAKAEAFDKAGVVHYETWETLIAGTGL